MRKNEIMVKMSESIEMLVRDGYHLELTELRCLFSNIDGHAVLAKGNEREVVWVKEHRIYTDDGRRLSVLDLNRAHITLRGRETMDDTYRDPRKWESGIVETHRVYNIDSWGYSKWYVESIEEFDEINAKRMARATASRNSFDSIECKDFEMTDRLFKIVRKVHGFKSAKRSDIRVSKLPKRWDGATGCYYCIQNARTGTIVNL